MARASFFFWTTAVDETDETDRKRSFFVQATAVAILLVLYVLSTFASNTEFFVGDPNYLADAIHCFYYPLSLIYESESGERLFVWYYGFWE